TTTPHSHPLSLHDALPISFASLKLLDDKNQPFSAIEIPSQIMVRRGQAAPGETVVLAKEIDLNRHYAITKPGTYSVQFAGSGLRSEEHTSELQSPYDLVCR